MAPIHRAKEQTCYVREAAGCGHSDKILQGTICCNGDYLKHNTGGFSLCQNGSIASLDRSVGVTGSGFDCPVIIDVENSTSSVTTSSYSLRDLGNLQIAHSPTNTCSARPVEESEAMRKWKEIKQNGFLSHPNGGVPMSEPQHGKRCKKKTKVNEQKRKTEAAKAKVEDMTMEPERGEHDNRKIELPNQGQDKRKVEALKVEHVSVLKNAPSSGLLSTISTGIIRRVKNYEEVLAVLEDMVRLEKPTSQKETELRGQ